MPLTIDQKREHQRLASQRFREAHPDRQRLADQRFRKAHPDRAKASSRAYYETHKEDAAKLNRLWREAHPGYNRLWYETHKEAVRLRHRAYALANPDIRKAIRKAVDARHRARKLGALASLTTTQWKAIVAAYKGRCAYCGVKPKQITQDHVLPLARGGHHTPENVVPACMPCNQHKHTGSPPLIPSLRLLL